MDRSFLQVVHHCVGDPGQVTHVPSPHPTRYPGNQEVEMYAHTQTQASMYVVKPNKKRVAY